jgi:hypothetical protein
VVGRSVIFVSACFFDGRASLGTEGAEEVEKGESNNGRSVSFRGDRKG